MQGKVGERNEGLSRWASMAWSLLQAHVLHFDMVLATAAASAATAAINPATVATISLVL